jgi:hypothetical protein
VKSEWNYTRQVGARYLVFFFDMLQQYVTQLHNPVVLVVSDGLNFLRPLLTQDA